MSATFLVVTSNAAGFAVVPILAAVEACDLRVRAIDVGDVGGKGSGVGDRIKRAFLGESAERRLRREVENSNPDCAVVFDPWAAIAMTVVRDQVAVPVPVVAVVDSIPDAAWAQTDADRFFAADDAIAFALQEHGVEADRIVVVGAVGEYAFAAAASEAKAQLRSRFKFQGKVVLVAIAGMAAETIAQLLLQLSLAQSAEATTYLFDAGTDTEAAAMVRRQVPVLGLKGKLFGATADAPLFWRAADVVIATPSGQHLARTALVGTPLIAMVTEPGSNHDGLANYLSSRRAGVLATSALLVSGALEQCLAKAWSLAPSHDGAAVAADMLGVITEQKRAVIEERKATVIEGVRAKARNVAATAAPPGDLEDLGGGLDADFEVGSADVANLRNSLKARFAELGKQIAALRLSAEQHDKLAAEAAKRGEHSEAGAASKAADVDRAKMHAILADMSVLEREIADLDRVKSSGPVQSGTRPTSERRGTIDDELTRLKSQARVQGATSAGTPPRQAAATGAKPAPTLDDELSALKKKMAAAPPKKKP